VTIGAEARTALHTRDNIILQRSKSSEPMTQQASYFDSQLHKLQNNEEEQPDINLWKLSNIMPWPNFHHHVFNLHTKGQYSLLSVFNGREYQVKAWTSSTTHIYLNFNLLPKNWWNYALCTALPSGTRDASLLVFGLVGRSKTLKIELNFSSTLWN
jgi:hypothetical protein